MESLVYLVEITRSQLADPTAVGKLIAVLGGQLTPTPPREVSSNRPVCAQCYTRNRCNETTTAERTPPFPFPFHSIPFVDTLFLNRLNFPTLRRFGAGIIEYSNAPTFTSVSRRKGKNFGKIWKESYRENYLGKIIYFFPNYPLPLFESIIFQHILPLKMINGYHYYRTIIFCLFQIV